MDLDKVREAAERVARSEGLEIFDVEWKIGKQRLLRIYIDRPPDPANPAAGVSHSDRNIFAGDAAAPIHYGTEHIEDQRADVFHD